MSTQLLAGEVRIRLTRQHWSVFIPAVAGALLVLLVVGIIVVLLPSAVDGHAINTIRLFVFLVAVLLVGGFLSLRYLRWRFTTFLLTSHRIVVSRGVLSRYMETIALDRIQDVNLRQGFLARIFKTGDVEIESASEDGAATLSQITDPVGFSNRLQHAAELRRFNMPYSDAAPAPSSPPGPAYPPARPGHPPQQQQQGYPGPPPDYPAGPGNAPGQTGYPPPGQTASMPQPGYRPPGQGL